ncbi:MAG: NAD(P)-dependent oxidoreductase [Planctomycetes bacterium]|jgi:3-hydroxyisobutyrate dehydrogenase-like beta-hydroxyacid dehydrogenase|nr:NAD(P)-dependent oxidoreductase [Planctomycetota bacterium]
MNKPRVGFIGMGIMGGSMAANCIKAGFEVTVYNRSASKTARLRDMGARVAQTPAELAAQCDVVLSCVTHSHDVLEVMLDARIGVISTIRPGSLVIDHSTVAPSVAHRCSREFLEKDVHFLDAPISGGDLGAKAGTLSIMVGGDKQAADRARAVLQAMGKTITYCGPSGSGYVVKLCNQILVGVHLVAAAEALSLAKSAGVELPAMLAAVSSGAAGSWTLSNLGPKMINGDNAPGFFVDYLLKDLHMAQELAANLKTPLAGTAIAEAMMLSTSAHGFGRCGTQAVYQSVRRLANRQE